MVEPGAANRGTNNSSQAADKFVFWNGDGQIVPHLLFEFYSRNGIGKYYYDVDNWKITEPVIVKINCNIVSEVNVSFLIETAKNYIYECTEENGEAGPIIDSFHKNTSLFGSRNLQLLPTLQLDFLTDTRNEGYLYFQNLIVKVTAGSVTVHDYDEFDQYIWERSIIKLDFNEISEDELKEKCDFNTFLTDLSVVEDLEQSAARLKSLKSAIGYLIHRYKDGNTNQAIILMDIYVDGMPNGGSGKSLLITSIGKIRILAVIDGKKYDQKEWFALSSVGLDSEVLLFDDVKKDFNFEQLFPLTSGGMYVRRKYKDHIHIPHEKSPKIALTTNYAINGDSSSHRRRKFEFEVSTTYSADYSPRDKFGRNFFDDWSDNDWTLFYNTMIRCMQVYLSEGLVESVPISLKLTKLVNNTCEEFIEFVNHKLELNLQLDKKTLYESFASEYPEYKYQITQRKFTQWLRTWAEFKNYNFMEGHTGDTRYIIFSKRETP